MLTKTTEEYNLFMDVALVKSAVNRADALTRIPQCWLTAARKESEHLQQLCTAFALEYRLRVDHEHT